MRSGGGVLLVSTCQMIVGVIFLGLYEGYKARVFAARAAPKGRVT